MKKRKIGSITCNWNGERFIVPHLKMLRSYGVEKSIVLQGTAPWADYQAEYDISFEPDKSEQMIKDSFPEVEIHKTWQNVYDSKLYNQGLEILEDCDLVLRLDYDMFLTKKDWKTFIDLLTITNYDLYRLNFSKRTINYYYDHDHGVMNALEEDPIAMSPGGRMINILDYVRSDRPPTLYTISDEDFMIHHYRGWKGYGIDKNWIEDEIPSPHDVYARDLVRQYGKDGKWFSAPKEIRRGLVPPKEDLK